ncbi:MAG: hypothetical protein DWH74_00945 [Planctomycetota bacterium]|nr:MAG: hypothetical protein DWH74_00945 [Planctomycetota bacterium]
MGGQRKTRRAEAEDIGAVVGRKLGVNLDAQIRQRISGAAVGLLDKRSKVERALERADVLDAIATGLERVDPHQHWCGGVAHRFGAQRLGAGHIDRARGSTRGARRLGVSERGGKKQR